MPFVVGARSAFISREWQSYGPVGQSVLILLVCHGLRCYEYTADYEVVVLGSIWQCFDAARFTLVKYVSVGWVLVAYFGM